MKHLKSYEDKKKSLLKFVKSSELGDSWSVDKIFNKDKEKHLTGKKNLDIKLGQKVVNLLEKYNLSVDSVGPNNWIYKNHLLLQPEKTFKEYRIYLIYNGTLEEYLDNEGIENYEELSEEDQEEIFKVYNKYDKFGDTIEWSVFLPVGTKDIINSAFSDSTDYLNLLNESFPDIFKFNIENDICVKEPINFKKFINKKNIQITNECIEDVSTTSNRIYKDSKVFGELRNCIGDNKTKNLINEWLKL